jgi:hypothetical protein
MPIEIHRREAIAEIEISISEGRERSRRRCIGDLSTETVEGTALALESVNNVEGCDGLSLGVLSVGDGITDDTLEEGLQNTASLFVDHCDALAC